MKHFSCIKLLTMAAILFTATAFSCEDHNIPDPVTNCNRVDGTPRAFNCEFEFVKAEFYRTEWVSPGITDTISYGTVTPGSANLEIKEPYYRDWVVSDVSQFFYMPIKVKLTIRRIAPAPAGSNKYILRNNLRDAVPGNPGPGEYSSKSGWDLEPDDELKQVSIDIPVGATYAYHQTYEFSGRFEYGSNFIIYRLANDYYFLVQNVATSKTLREAPYNYQYYRDMAEARLIFHPTVKPAVCAPCRQVQ